MKTNYSTIVRGIKTMLLKYLYNILVKELEIDFLCITSFKR